jgi:hypothetical protein
MEFRLSESLSHELFLFSRWTSGYQEALFTNFFFFLDGISAIRKPFSRTFSFFHDGLLAIRKPFSRTFSFFSMEFSRHKIRNMQFGGRLFSYIYQKEYLHGTRLVRNLAS